MKRYPKYRNSGIEWIGEIPEHWYSKKIKYLLTQKKGALKTGPFGSQLKNTELDDKGTIKVYNQRNVLDKDFDKGIEYINDKKFEELKDFEIFDNDILITSRGTIGKCAIFPPGQKRGILHPCLIRMQINNELVSNQWILTYINDSKLFLENVLINSNATTIDVIYGNTLREIVIPTPSLDEQKLILDYLDQKTKQIDALIEKKQKLIELLKEQRTAIINQAVTKGFDPNVPMKDSGIEWLGEIPEHWEVKRIKYLLKPQKGALKTGPFGSQLKNSELDENGKIKVYNQRNVLDSDFESGDEFINEIKFNELKDFEIQEDDILITSRGTIGKCEIFPKGKKRGVLHPCLIRMQINQEIALNKWVITYINESSYFNESVLLNSNATTIDVIYGNTLREVIIPTPPKDEQKIILDYIFKIINKVGKSIKNNEQIIEKLKEYRTTLISEVVTGKIDVRDEVEQ